MKCPKCGYLGFETVDRCRNCGYEFSLTSTSSYPELSLRGESPSEIEKPFDDLGYFNNAPPDQIAERATAFASAARTVNPAFERTPSELPLFGGPSGDDVPLITRPSAPRAPLAVRRATPEVPRLRTAHARAPMLDLGEFEEEVRTPSAAGEVQPASLAARVTAVVIDLLILASIDMVVIYFTMQICGLSASEIGLLPIGPLLAFLVFENGGYLVAFTAGGQTLGKMATGIRVVSAHPNRPLDLGHSIVRTAVWALLAIPVGLGFVTTFFSIDRRGLHDRCAGTRVVRASA
jgi:uncharacterized RDD family membrane protein YckC